jgi:hypothetical protein
MEVSSAPRAVDVPQPPGILRIIETPQPSAALIIATFAAVPYVHLALECWRRYYPSVPLLVSDDGSTAAPRLRDLCGEYGAEFRKNPQRKRRTIGDLSSYLYGLEWAGALGVDLLVKMSRRFIPLHNWLPSLQEVAWETQYATYSNRCLHFNFGFRTECIGFHIESWNLPAVQGELRYRVERNEPIFVERYLHQVARYVNRGACAHNRHYEGRNPRPPDADAYGVWEIMPDRRVAKKPDILWHDSDAPADYCRIACLFGLGYRLQEFLDPNAGEGLGQE